MKTDSIGVVIPTADNSFFSGLAARAAEELADKGYRALICSCGNDAEREKSFLRSLAEDGVKGILCISGLSVFPEELLPPDFPLVWIDRIPASGRSIPWVANDDEDAMEKAVRFLIDRGCREILLAPGYQAEDRESPRVRGYRKALEEAGLPFTDGHILKRQGLRSSESETEEMVRRAIGDGLRVDGIITSSDRAAFGAMTALRSVGLYVPEDVRLISFDNSPYSAMATPSVTALDRNPGQLARKAVEILLDQLGGTWDGKCAHVLPVSLVERVSTR